MANNEEAHRALDRVGVKRGPLPVRVLEAADIIESQRTILRSMRYELNELRRRLG